jgi:type II secretion system protein L
MGYAIGIDLSSHGIRIVQVSRRRGRLHVHGTYAREVGCRESSEGDAGAGALLAETIREANFRANATVVVGLPYEKVFFSALRTDVAKPEDVRRLLKFELEDDLPLPFDELVADICGCRHVSEGQHEYLIAAVSRDEIDTWAHALNDAGHRCSVCSTDVCALEAVARLVRPDESDGPTISVHVDGHRMILGLWHGGTILCARQMACTGDAEMIRRTLAREIELTLRRTLGRKHQQPLEILLSGSGELVRELSGRLPQATGHAVRLLGPSSITCPSGALDLDGQFTIALGLALIGLGSTGNELNFLNADLSQVDRAAKSRAKQAALVFVALLVAILGLLGLRTFWELRALEAERAGVSREIRTVFAEAFPEEKKIVNEPAQMKEHLDSLRKEHDMLAAVVGKRIQPLRVLHILSERMTSEKGIGISSFSIKDRTVHVAGTGNSFESIEQFLEELRQVPEFASIELEDMAQSRGSDHPEFRLLITVKIG